MVKICDVYIFVNGNLVCRCISLKIPTALYYSTLHADVKCNRPHQWAIKTNKRAVVGWSRTLSQINISTSGTLGKELPHKVYRNSEVPTFYVLKSYTSPPRTRLLCIQFQYLDRLHSHDFQKSRREIKYYNVRGDCKYMITEHCF